MHALSMALRIGFLPAVACLSALFEVVAGQQQQQQQQGHTASAPPAHRHPNDQMLEVHGVFMAVSFVALLPISVIFAATRDRLWRPKIWFQTHRALNLLATVLITIGAILGIVGWAQISSLGHVRRLLLAHMVIGLILFGFVIIQVSAALVRPSHTSNLRRVWAPVHHNIGRLALFLGFANAIIGAYAAHMGADWYIWICVVWGVIMLVGIGLIAYSRTRPVRPAAEGKVPSGTATAAQPGYIARDTNYI